ncbi:MAG: acetate--CoA ligase family protein, partial [Frankiaceae bacterium]|nr:acetate--CoA ligase family protein [Frankiaceae bacterium]
ADVSGNDLLQYWETDPATDIALMYLESFGNPRKFARLARRLGRRKPVVVVKSRRAAPPPGLAGTTIQIPESSVQALFHSAGVIRVDTITELFDVAAILAAQPRPAGDRVAVVGNSAALGRIVLDALAAEGLPAARVVDTGAGASPDQCAAALREALADDGVDAAIALFVPPVQRPDAAEFAAAVRAAAAGAPKPVIATFVDGAATAAPGAAAAAASDVPSFVEPERGVAALARVIRYSRWRDAPLAPLPDPAGLRSADARALLSAALPDSAPPAPEPGQAQPQPGASAGSNAQPEPDAPAEPDAPIELDAAAVRAVLGAIGVELAEPAAAASTAPSAAPATGPASPRPAPALEVVLAVRDDPAFGSVISFGLDGPIAAALDTPSYAVVPLTVADAAALVGQSRAAGVLRAWDGEARPAPADSPAAPVARRAATMREGFLGGIEDLALRLSMLVDEAPEIAAARLGPIGIDPASGRPIVRGAQVAVRRPAGATMPGPRRMSAR